MKHEELTERIIGAFFQVHSSLGFGFLEKVYESALCVEFDERGLSYQRQVPIKVKYRDRMVGDFVADLVVEGLIIVEVKATTSLSDADRAQTLNYLHAAHFRLGILVNFGHHPGLQHDRIVL